MSTRLHIVVPDELVARIDARLGPGQPRADWIRRVLESELNVVERFREVEREVFPERFSEGTAEQALVEATAQGSRSVEDTAPAPAEQPRVQQSYLSRGSQRVPGPNVENVRSSAQSKRDVRPVPKGGKS